MEDGLVGPVQIVGNAAEAAPAVQAVPAAPIEPVAWAAAFSRSGERSDQAMGRRCPTTARGRAS
eukprot:9650963-Lingulodinium_polyedra.AAC.1